MRLLHTANWHLGRVFQRVRPLEDQRAVLDGVFKGFHRAAREPAKRDLFSSMEGR